MFYLREDVSEGTLPDLLEWGTIIHGPTPTVIKTKGGGYMATLAYRGQDIAMLEPEARVVYLHRLHAVLMRLGTSWSLLFDQWHEASTDYPTTAWRNPTACFVDAARRALFASGALYEDQQFCTVGWQPTTAFQAKWYERFFQTQPRAGGSEDQYQLETYLHTATRWADGLHGLLPAWHWLDPEETLTYLHRGVSWARQRVGMPDLATNLHARLADTSWLPGDTPELGGVLLRPIEILQWPGGRPEEGGGLGMDVPLSLQGLPFPYRFTVRYLPLDKDDAEQVLRDYERKWDTVLREAWPKLVQVAFPAEAEDHLTSVGRALQSLRANEVRYGYTTPTVLVWGETVEELTHREREVVKALQSTGLVVSQDHVNACQAWLGMQPGDTVHNMCKPLLPSLGVAFLVPHATVWAGDAQDAHFGGPPLLMASSDNVPFRFVLHPGASELGNTMVLGPSRSGKSGLLALMMSQFCRYAALTIHHCAQIFCFDKDEALMGVTLFHGGRHYNLGAPGSRGLQPFGRLHDGEHEQRWALHWISQVIMSQGVTLGPDDREQLWLAMTRLAAFPAPMRTLKGYAELLQVQRLKRALVPFLQGGPYAFLDADHDDIGTHDWTTFEMRGLLDLPEVLPHVLRYRFHRMSERFDGRPTLIVIDEARKLLADPVFGPEILDFLKERAKVNVSVVLSTQEIADAASTPAWQAIQASCKTWVYLPNDAATKPSVAAFYKECGLTEAQIQLLAVSTPKQDYLYKTDTSLRRFQLILSPLERALVAASTMEERVALKALLQEAHKESLVTAWLKERGFHLEGEIYEHEYARPAA